MKFVIIFILMFSLFSCDTGQITEEDVTEIVQQELSAEEEPEEPTEPKWSPEPLNVYIFEEETEQSEETAIKTYTASDNSNYYFLVQAVKSRVEIHNRDYEIKWVWTGGGKE